VIDFWKAAKHPMGRLQFASDVGYLYWRPMPRYDKTGLL
jgi:hypothetical protein